MELTIHAQKIEITQRLENYVEKKTEKLDRYMSNLSEVRVDLSAENTRSAVERQVAQVTIRDERGTILRAEERSNDIFAAIDAAMDKIHRQIRRYRGKRQRRYKSGMGVDEFVMSEVMPPEEQMDEGEEGTEPQIVRSKRFAVHPMSAVEAIDQMELLGHDFFVFFNAEVEAINVIYRRRDGDYGLLYPELD